MYIYDSKNLVWLLCSKAKIPYLVLSNWNSLTPTITFTQQLPFQSIDIIKYLDVNEKLVYILGMDKLHGSNPP